MPHRDNYIQSSATDNIGKDTKEKIAAMMKELEAIGARISMILHDEMIFDCVPGTKDQVKAIHEKYFPQEPKQDPTPVPLDPVVIEYALQRWARGEEEQAKKGAIDWLRVLSAAMAGTGH